jgi:hypothetical protein
MAIDNNWSNEWRDHTYAVDLRAKLDICIQALQSIGIILSDTEDPRDSLDLLRYRWRQRDKEQLINTMVEDTQICRDALKKIGALK